MSTIIGRASAKLIFALLVSFLGLFYIVNAEEGVEVGVSAPEVVAPSPASDTGQQANETAVTDGRFLCSDQYRRNSIGVNIYTNHSTVVAGTPLSFTGEIENKNSYPITSGEVWVKVYQVENASDATKRKRTNQVAYFKAIDNLTIKAYAKEAVNFNWTPSAGLLGGDYDATYHFLSNDRFYHFGLPYLDEQGGSYTTFKVEGTDQGTVYFDRESIKLNNVPYGFSATTPVQFGDQEIVFVQGALVNPTAEEKLVEVTWKTSTWGTDRENSETLIDKQFITVRPGSRYMLSHMPLHRGEAITHIEAEVKDRDITSTFSTWFSRRNIEEARISFASISEYPLVAEKENKIFACVEGVPSSIASDLELSLSVLDKKGREVFTHKDTVSLMNGEQGIITPILSNQEAKSFTVLATLTKDGQVLDKAEVTYSCESFGGEGCGRDFSLPGKLPLLAVIVGLAGLIFVLRFYQKRRNHIIAE